MKLVMGNGLKENTTNNNNKNPKSTREKGCLTIGLKREKIFFHLKNKKIKVCIYVCMCVFLSGFQKTYPHSH